MTSTIGAAATASQRVGSPVRAANQPRERIQVGQIGMGHNHASAKMAALRKLKDQYEVVGVVEPDLKWRKKRGDGWFRQPCLQPFCCYKQSHLLCLDKRNAG